MALIVLLKGVNVGGHRRFRPSILATKWSRYGAVSVGAAGTFVIRKPVSQAHVRAELAHRLPFEVDVITCNGRDMLRLISRDPFAGQCSEPGLVSFVSVLAQRRKPLRPFPLTYPTAGPWSLRLIECDGRFVLGCYRREMKAIRYLGQLEKLFGVPITTRSWSTILAVGRILRPAG
jgi:uncharacterized protein (DUF1697 family)